MDFKVIFKEILKQFVENEKDQEAIWDFTVKIVTELKKLKLGNVDKMRRAIKTMNKIDIPDNIKQLLISLAIEFLKSRILHLVIR